MRQKPIEGAQRCRGPCKRVLPLSAYHLDSYALNGRQSYCPECKAAATTEAYWQRTYGVTGALAGRCLALQGDVCPVCGLALGLREAVVDHDHETHEVRGLLHRTCNTRAPFGPDGAARWYAYHREPPMRAAAGGPLYLPALVGGQLSLGAP